MKRFAVKIAYLGDGFSGSQVQPDARTVESEVLANLVLVTRMDPSDLDLRFSSRTDKGVNALGNAVVFYSILEDGDVLTRALNSVSRSIFYRSYCEVDDGFNPRHASRRTYRYVLPAEGMDIGLAEECAEMFLGEHDFARFCRYDGKPTVATVDSITVMPEGDTVVLEFKARFFLWNMIRRISSAIHAVSTGRSDMSEVRSALDGKDVSFGVSRPDALTLVDVEYDWLEFVPADPRRYSRRRDGEILTSELRMGFLRSL
ncbi:MAG: tRNA pseudouridine(38-40) synthase TruA [Candidatus Methanomethylophilaceae archaeon]|nr:tRNA pseudouridine(38-40) synthase TruA [Candidatus Methanomethylophilaceae archaeon]